MTEWTHGEYTISTDRSRLNLAVVHGYLSTESYWAQGRTQAVVEKAIENSLCFGVYHLEQQIGFARLVTDYATYAYLPDVFILPAHQGGGLGKWLVQSILGAPEVQMVKRWLLHTRDAHGLYAQFGFTPLASPEMVMERRITPPVLSNTAGS